MEHIRSFSIAYPDPSFSELEYANDMAQHYGTDQTVLMIEGLTMEDLESAVYHLDEPMTDLSAIPLMLICRKAKETVTVVLSGEGGDEIFAGYDRFKASKAAGYLNRLPGCAPCSTAWPPCCPTSPRRRGRSTWPSAFWRAACCPAKASICAGSISCPRPGRGTVQPRGRGGAQHRRPLRAHPGGAGLLQLLRPPGPRGVP